MEQAVREAISELGYVVIVPLTEAATIVTFDFDDVLNRTKHRGAKRWHSPSLTMEDEPNTALIDLLFQLKHIEHLTGLQVAIVTNREANAQTIRYTMEYLEQHGLNGLGLIMRDEGFSPDAGLKNKHKVVLALNSKLHVDDKEREVLNKLYPAINVYHLNTMDDQHWRDRADVAKRILNLLIDAGLLVLPEELIGGAANE